MFRKMNCKLIQLLLCMLICSCSAYGKDKAPYIANGDFLLGTEETDFKIAGINLHFYNKSEKNVIGFTAVFYLFDSDGEPITTGKNNIVITVQQNVSSMDFFEAKINLDKYFVTEPESAYTVDYFYISQIVYEDGTTWKDPLGMMAF